MAKSALVTEAELAELMARVEDLSIDLRNVGASIRKDLAYADDVTNPARHIGALAGLINNASSLQQAIAHILSMRDMRTELETKFRGRNEQ